MMRMTAIIFPFLIFVLSCNETNHAQSIGKKDSLFVSDSINLPNVFEDKSLLDSSALGIKFFPSGNYENIKSKINTRRLRYFNELSAATNSTQKDSILDDARIYFTNQLLNKIVPHWYGTVWDFNGYTDNPNKGVIACGYFVSTTLKHMGINVNRYKLAQQAGLNEAKTLEPEKDLLIYHADYSETLDSVFNKIKIALTDGLYFVGLDCHVGYIYVKDNQLYFLHSNYIDGYVMIEKAEYSDAFMSNIYVIADITHNDALILKWINNRSFPVVRG